MEDHKGQLLSRLKRNPNDVLIELYDNYRREFLSWSFKHFGIPEEDAQDCFQDAVIIFYRNVNEGRITELTSSIKTYLFSIGKNMVLRRYKKVKNEERLESHMLEYTVKENINYVELYSGNLVENRVADIVQNMKDPCKSILRYYYFQGFTMEEIAETMSYKNAETVKAQKLRCIKEIRSRVNRLMKKER